MKYDEFLGQVQYRARLADGGQAIRAIHATLETLGERLVGDEASDLAAQLPPEIGAYLKVPMFQEKFGLKEFFERVAEREEVPVSDAAFHACAVVSVLCDAVSHGEMADVRSQLPGEYDRLFEVAHLSVMSNGRV
jgi:uncharacterized protein (DUF2267 family)